MVIHRSVEGRGALEVEFREESVCERRAHDDVEAARVYQHLRTSRLC